ncbi:serine hydrolase domain-containing protein [Arcticibacterium luteifluviistationis]|uniref:Serine hydrolase n=1 Tax=Arcticibacterium luteifluviistationis TaxID=1784714 RepID=A0A2Z4GEP6_9BACT|nr:serine hydrolase domain-containing protein [Arcticibacterium luteifluviistationis]AWV99809.1 serine hydrolase [Arcticibacterium luteifluviistationis]
MLLKLFYSLLLFSFLFCSCDSSSGKQAIDNSVNEELLKQQKNDSIRIAISASKKEDELRAFVNGKVRKGFNGSILVAQSGVVLCDTSIGFASFEDSIRISDETPFQLASLSKTFTSVAVMQLVEKGKLSLDLTVKDYYPNFPYEGVTLRSLLSHRSGLPYYEYNFDLKARKEKIYPDNQMLLDWFSKADPSPKAFNLPDHYFSYNNTNFAILAAIVEKASGLSFKDYLKKEIFAPLGMSHSYFASELKDSTNRTFGYQNRKRIPFDIYDNIGGDKGVFSTTQDLLKWYKALRSETILKKETLREIYTPRSFEFPGLRNYGYGFRLWVNDKQQTDYIYHTGWWKGYNTIMFFDLREDFVIILLSNRYNRDVYHIKDVIDILHDGEKKTTVEENILDE